MNILLKISSLALSAMLLISCTGCDSQKTSDDVSANYADIVLGQDFTDLNVKLNVLTSRTDLIADDPNIRDFQDYKQEFNEMYPNIDILFEGFTDYDLDMKTRLPSGSWDICLIPSALPNSELEEYFEPICQYSELADQYNFIGSNSYHDQVYGIPSTCDSQGIVYNKKVWADAGITDIPRTPDDFIEALKKIKENTSAIPLYTNYAARWTLTAWDYYDSGATGNERYRYYVLPYESEPFSPHKDRTGIYEVYRILYNAVSEGLIEDDPASTNWELCKASMNNGEIGCMMLGSWAVPQMQSAGNHPEDIGYMPFPITVNGVQYATAGGNSSYGISKKISDDKKLAAKIFIKYMIEQSGYATDQGGISIVKGSEYSNVFEDFEGVELLMEVKPENGEEDIFSSICNASGLAIAVEPEHIIRIIDSAIDGTESLDDIIADWNAAWTEAQQQYFSEQ